uniref:FHA domain protein n=1 Tax=Brachypodium distachyon TaxID=15368 RepID=C3SA83_BRADI|nr:FHA domain protein [Brachypodium distachyon]
MPPPKPLSPPLPAQPEAEAPSRPDGSAAESTKPSPSSSMPPPPPPRPSQLSESEPGVPVDVSANLSPSSGDSPAEEAGKPGDTEMTEAALPEQRQQRPRAPYATPDWSAAPDHPFFLEVLKDGAIFEKLDVSKKGAYMFGRIDLCDFVLEHPTISRFHAVLQFRNDGDVFLYDLGSTHGSSINKSQSYTWKICFVIGRSCCRYKSMSPRYAISLSEFKWLSGVFLGWRTRRRHGLWDYTSITDPSFHRQAPSINTRQNLHKLSAQLAHQLTNRIIIPSLWWQSIKAQLRHELQARLLELLALDHRERTSQLRCISYCEKRRGCGHSRRRGIASGQKALARPAQSTLACHVGVETYKFVFLTSRAHTCQVVTLVFCILQIKKRMYTKIHVGDVIRFGQSSRLYIFQGPSELMPPEKDMQKLRDAKIRQNMVDREASLLRAKTQAALAEGISWGMGEDAIDESAEDEADEITWQNYKGQLTDRQEKTRSKIIKRMEKVANMKKEIDAIRVKDISQGGLTQGQQTQIARNEQRISQIMEELENLEETLNDSIQESLGARAGKPKRGSHKASLEEEDDAVSDDDEFYDRTKKKSSSDQSNLQPSVETADSLLDKKDSITNDIEGKKKLLEDEKDKLAQRDNADPGDDLDAYMSGLSSQLEFHRGLTFLANRQKELYDLQAELDKVVYLLKVADPMGEAVRKRDLKPREANHQVSSDPRTDFQKQDKIAQNKTSTEENLKDSCSTKTELDKPAEVQTDVSNNRENATKPAFTIPKPQWLGDKRIIEPEENCIKEGNVNADESDNFVDYKDRKTVLSNSANEKDLEEAAPGLILRKRKSADQSAGTQAESSSVESEASAADAVALLLKYRRGLQTSEDMDNENEQQDSKRKGKKSKQKRVLGPARPDFLEKGPDYETWVPPEGQTGDGRTSLNERLGY